MHSFLGVSQSHEDYLEAIFHLIQENKVARVKDIATKLDLKNSSVTLALGKLKKLEFIEHTPYSYIVLTKKGEEIAKNVIVRHNALMKFFIRVLDVDKVKSEKAACAMEHGVLPEIIEKLIKFDEFLDTCTISGEEWVRCFRSYCDGNLDPKCCDDCGEDSPPAKESTSKKTLRS